MDESVAAFGLDAAPVRGRYARLGAATVDAILARHAYPWPVALLLGEALTLAALVSALLKTQGRFSVQAQGSGPVSLLVAECGADGDLRGYARLQPDAPLPAQRMTPRALLGDDGALAMTLDRGDLGPPHQGIVALDGDTLAEAAESYFTNSEQTPTRVKLAVARAFDGAAAPVWRAGGALIQRIAGDAARGDTQEDWRRAEILFATLRDDELVDPALGADGALYRLFHEEGVRMAAPAPLIDRCSCTEERLFAVLRTLSREDLHGLVEDDGAVHARCQFCARDYVASPERILG